MTKRILLVFSRQDRGLRNELEDRLEGLSETAPTSVQNEESAIQRVLDDDVPYDFVVVGPSLARKAAGAEVTSRGGLVCCRELRRRRVKIPMALLVPEHDQRMYQEWASFGLTTPPLQVKINPDWVDQIVGAILSIPTVKKRLDVIIKVDEGDWEYQFRAVGFRFHPANGVLHVEPAQRMLWDECDMNEPRWYLQFSRIGESIAQCLFKEKYFARLLDDGMQLAGGPQNTRVTFSVNRSLYPLLLEAIRNPRFSDAWMLHTPMLRHMSADASDDEDILGRPFKPVRILIVCADTSGYVEIGDTSVQRTINLPRLANVRKECAHLDRMLRDEYARLGGSADIRLIGSTKSPLTCSQLLEALRDEERWDLIHFAGHSLFELNQAYLFTQGSDGPEAVKFSRIAPWLNSTRVLYLSSCQGGNAEVAAEAAKAQVGAVVGFRWKVSDEDAEEHAAIFYRELLNLGSIDQAFWRTRRRFFEEHQEHDGYRKQHNAWASSILVAGTH